MKQHKVRFLNGQGTIIEIDGQNYMPGKKKYCMKDGVKHIKYTEFKPFNLEARDKALSELGDILQNKIPPKRIIEEMFKGLEVEEINKMLEKLKSGELKVKTTDGCLGLTLNNKKRGKKSFLKIIN